ncbi:gag-protease polyprotein [Trifolium repens]|nr:gag-protease polyprotein [Trifolium repens]
MTKGAKFISEGGSSNRPPLFEGDDYYYWKDKMELFLRSQDTNMWSVIEIGEYVPLMKDTTTPKTQGEWSTQEADRVLLNTKAKLFIKSAMSREEYDRIMQCKTTKEMWETLEIHHEGTSRVKEIRIDIGVRKFELFEMQEDESIDQMYGRFTIIINELNSLGKTYTTHETIRKLLRCLTKSWRHIVTAITESKDLSQMKLEDLIGSLKAHESILQEDKPVKKKMIALDSQTIEHSQNVENNFENDETLQEDDNEEMAFLSRRIQRLMQRRNQLKKTFQPRRSGFKETDISKVKCYGCDQFGHYKNECPNQKKPFF